MNIILILIANVEKHKNKKVGALNGKFNYDVLGIFFY